MKKIVAIIRPDGLGRVCAVLEKAGYPGVTVSNVEGHGTQKGFRERKVRGTTHRVPFVEKKKIELIVKDSQAAGIIRAISEAARTGEVGDGKIFISPMDDVIRIRTGESGETAI